MKLSRVSSSHIVSFNSLTKKNEKVATLDPIAAPSYQNKSISRIDNINNTNINSNIYSQFFPTRPNFSADALAGSVSDPGRETSSLGKQFDQVAADARQLIDANYKSMATSGRPVSNSYVDLVTSMGNLDRRSLYAVSSNEGGYFSKSEQNGAASLMSKQQELAMGYWNYPGSSTVFDAFAGNETKRFESLSKFLQGVSFEEKQSGEWMVQASEANRRLNEGEEYRRPEMRTFFDIVFEAQNEKTNSRHENAERQTTRADNCLNDDRS